MAGARLAPEASLSQTHPFADASAMISPTSRPVARTRCPPPAARVRLRLPPCRARERDLSAKTEIHPAKMPVTLPAMKPPILAALTLAAPLLLALAPGRARRRPASDLREPTSSPPNSNGTPASTVPAFSANGAPATGYATPTGFLSPTGVAYNPTNNTVYVDDSPENTIRTFNATTGAETTTSTGFGDVPGLNRPLGLAYRGGMLYAANSMSNTITAYNAANGQPVTSGFTSPSDVSEPTSITLTATTLYVVSQGTAAVYAFKPRHWRAHARFPDDLRPKLSGQRDPLLATTLFVSQRGNNSPGLVGEYDATTGLAINANFLTGLNNPTGLGIMGSQLLVVSNGAGSIGAYGIPALPGGGPTSTNPNFITGLNSPAAFAVVPEPGTWALMGLAARLSLAW